MNAAQIKHALKIFAMTGRLPKITYGKETKGQKSKALVLKAVGCQWTPITQIIKQTRLSRRSCNRFLAILENENKIEGIGDRYCLWKRNTNNEKQSLPAVGAIAGREMQREVV